jgi:hypothetical protein
MYNVVQRMTIVNIIRMNVICKFQICRVNCVSIVNLEKSLCGIRIMLVCVCTRVVSSFCYRPTCTTNNNTNAILQKYVKCHVKYVQSKKVALLKTNGGIRAEVVLLRC